MDRRGAGEAVAAHVLGDGVGGGKADDPVAFRFIGLADRGHRIALAGAGLAVDDREALGAGGVMNSARLLARDSFKFLRAENFRADDAADHVTPVLGQAIGGSKHVPLRVEDARCRVARDRAVRFVRKADDVRPGQNLFDEGTALGLVLDLLRQAAVEVAFLEGRALLGRQFDDGPGVALVDGVPELVGLLAPGANDPAAMVALVGLGPTRQLQVVPFEVVGATGVGIDLGRDDMQVGIAFVVVRREKGAGIAHAHGRQGALRCGGHLLARRLFARSPA